MSENKFIDHFDPTTPLDLDGIELKNQYSKLTEHEKLLVFCKLNGYTMIPPTVRQMYEDEYYLGGEKFYNNGSVVFDYWKDILENEIFSGILMKKNYLVLSGAIGIGKSTCTRICLAMTHAKLLCMKNPSKTLGLAPKPLTAVFFHKNEQAAVIENINWHKEVMEFSPFFKNTKNGNLKFKVRAGGFRSSVGLGQDLPFVSMGEINFVDNQEMAKKKLSEFLIRFKSRLSDRALEQVGMFILDSSARGNADSTEWFLENSDPARNWNCKPPIYEVRPNLFERSQGKTFKVYTGDSRFPPQIMAGDELPNETMDPDKVIKVPIQLLPDYKMNLIKSLQDFSGVSTGSSDSFFGGNIEHLMNCSKLPNRIPEVITVDFYNKQERLYDKIKPMLGLCPFHTPLWIGLDLSAAQGGDATGISAVSFEGWKMINGTKMPQVKCWFTVAIKNKDGQEISLFHIYQLIQDLSKYYNILVSADQAFSRQILQDCERDRIKTNGRISTDLVPCEPAIYLKNLINNELIQVPFHKRLQREAYDLYYTPTGKIDHPKKASVGKEFDNPDGTKIGSKDVWDSLASACYSLKMSIDAGEENGYNGEVSKTMQAMKNVTTDPREEAQKRFQNMLENLW